MHEDSWGFVDSRRFTGFASIPRILSSNLHTFGFQQRHHYSVPIFDNQAPVTPALLTVNLVQFSHQAEGTGLLVNFQLKDKAQYTLHGSHII